MTLEYFDWNICFFFLKIWIFGYLCTILIGRTTFAFNFFSIFLTKIFNWDLSQSINLFLLPPSLYFIDEFPNQKSFLFQYVLPFITLHFPHLTIIVYKKKNAHNLHFMPIEAKQFSIYGEATIEHLHICLFFHLQIQVERKNILQLK